MMRLRETMARLEQIMEALSGEDRQSLLAFAEFLSTRATGRRTEDAAPEPMPPPAGETVVAAIRRLSAQYPKLDRASLLDVTSRSMGEHVLRGREAEEVIAELQSLFESRHQDLVHRGHNIS